MRRIPVATALVISSLCLIAAVGCSQPDKEPSLPSPPAPPAPPPAAAGMPALQSVAGTGTPVEPASDAFSFWVWGDNRDGGDVFDDVLAALEQAKPAFVLSLGDIIAGEPDAPLSDSDETSIAAALSSYASSVAATGVPVFNAPGNHEMIAKNDGKECPNAEMHSLYLSHVSPTLYGAFDFGNSRFISLNTDDLPVDCSPLECPICEPCLGGGGEPVAGAGADDDLPWECSFIGQAQLDALAADLAANADKTHIFILMHYPMKPSNPKDRLIDDSAARLAAILEAHQQEHRNISFVLGSHEHLFWNPQPIPPGQSPLEIERTAGEDPYYLVTGGAGARLSTGTSGSFHHYLVFDVDGDDVKVTVVKVVDQAA